MTKKVRFGPKMKRFKLITYIKIHDEPNGKENNWMQYHRYLWIKRTGKPIPKGMCVVFLDRNTKNFNEDNLMCMTLGDYSRYLDSRFPERKKKRIERSARSHKNNYRKRVSKKTKIIMWYCSNCGYSDSAKPEKYPKCQHYSFEEIRKARCA